MPKYDESAILEPIRTLRCTTTGATPVRLDIKPGDSTYPAKTRQVPWQLSLVKLLASCSGTVVESAPKGNAFVLFGEPDCLAALNTLLTPLLRDINPLADQEYLKYFYECKDNGNVEAARGYRAKWLDMTLDLIRTEYAPPSKAPIKAALAMLEDYRDKIADLQIKLRSEPRPEPPPKPRVIPEALVAVIEQSTQVAAKEDNHLTTVYRKALEHAGLRESSKAEGVCFDLTLKGASITRAIERAPLRLGAPPTTFCFARGYLYISSDTPPVARGLRWEADE